MKKRIRNLIIAAAMAVGMISAAYAAEPFENYLTVENGGSVQVDIVEGQPVYVQFVAPEDGIYYIYSEESDYDTYGYLYDVNGNSKETNDDSGLSTNFLFARSMVKDEVLYVGCAFYSNSRTGSYKLKVSTEELPTLYVGGVGVTKANADDVLGDGTVSYDFSTKTLTLDNANITTGLSLMDCYYGIYCDYWNYYSWKDIEDYITIVLVGDNTIDIQQKNEAYGYLAAIEMYATSIEGDGTLAINIPSPNAQTVDGIYSSVLMISADVSVDICGENVQSTYGVEAYLVAFLDGTTDINICDAHTAKGVSCVPYYDEADNEYMTVLDETATLYVVITPSENEYTGVTYDDYYYYNQDDSIIGVYAYTFNTLGDAFIDVYGENSIGMTGKEFGAGGDAVVEVFADTQATVFEQYTLEEHNIPNSVWLNTEPSSEGRVKWDGESNLNGTEAEPYRYFRLPAETVTVVFTDGQGNVILEEEVDFGDNAVAPEDPTREGYIFDGWDMEFNNVKESLEVTAKWKEAPAPAPAESSSSNLDPAPKTGVNESPLAIAALAVLAAFGVALVYRKERE